MTLSKHAYTDENCKDDRIPSTFKNFFSTYTEKTSNTTAPESNIMIKVASGCVECPYQGSVEASACDRCKFAAGLSYQNGTRHIKCSYSQEGMRKEASRIQPIHWSNQKLEQVSQSSFDDAKGQISERAIAELKYAAHKIGLELRQEHLDDFAKVAQNESGKNLERAARRFVTKIEEKVSLPLTRKNSGIINQIFSEVNRNSKAVISGLSSPKVGDNETAACNFLGSKTNPNTIWNSDALSKKATKPTSDEITALAKAKIAEQKQSIKAAYLKSLQDKLSSKEMISHQKVHPTNTTIAKDFNIKLPQNAMGVFGEHKEFENIAEKTAGEQLSDAKTQRANKKSEENKEIKIAKATTAESGNWLFK